MATVFDYNITTQEMNLLNIQDKEHYFTRIDSREAFHDLCNLLNLRNKGHLIVELMIMKS